MPAPSRDSSDQHPTMGLPAEAPPLAVQVPGYEVIREIARGGMGVIYLARQRNLGRLVALKVVLGGAHAGTAARARFEMEARAVARLKHPGIVGVYEVGECDGLPFFSMEYVEGGSLADLLRRGPQSAPAAARLVEQLGRAMFVAHEAGIIHRDLKPGNILLAPSVPGADQSPEERFAPKITDFGLARQVDDQSRLTRTGAVVGTPSYMAPEQAIGTAGGASHAIDHRADVYALGAILYECLTGRPPFLAEGPVETLLQVVRDDPVPPSRLCSGLPRDLETICLRCLAKDPRRRYVSALSLANDLAHFRAGQPIIARPTGSAERVIKWARRRPAVAALLAVIVLLTTASLGLLSWLWYDAEKARRGEQHHRELAEGARQAEQDLREEAERASGREQQQRLRAEEALYVSRITLADRELAAANVRQAEELIDACVPVHRHWEWDYLKARCRGGLATLTLSRPPFDGKPLNAVAVSPDGRTLAVGGGHINQSLPGALGLFDAATLKPIRTLEDHSRSVQSLTFSSDGTKLLSVSMHLDLSMLYREATNVCHAVTCQARIDDPATGKVLHTLADHSALVVAPDGLTMAGAKLGAEVVVWKSGGAEEGLRIPATEGLVNGLDFSPDGKRLAVSWLAMDVNRLRRGESGDKVTSTGVGVWDVADPAKGPTRVLKLDNARLGRFTPDGKSLAAVLPDHSIRLFDASTGKAGSVLGGHTQTVTHLSFGKDSRLFSTSRDRTLRVWDGKTGQLLLVHQGHRDQVSCGVPAPDGHHVFTSSWDSTVKCWDARRGPDSLLATIDPSLVYELAFVPGSSEAGRPVLTAVTPGGLLFLDVNTGKILADVRQGRYLLAFRADGKRLASNVRGGKAGVWSVSALLNDKDAAPEQTIGGHAGEVWRAQFSPDGKVLATGTSHPDSANRPGQLFLTELATGKQKQLDVRAKVLGLSFRPDGARLAAVTFDEYLQHYDTSSGKLLYSFRPATSTIGQSLLYSAVAYSPGGKLLAVCCANALDANSPGVIYLYDAESGKLLRVLGGHSALVRSLAFTPDGSRLASASVNYFTASSGEIKLWDVASGTATLTLPGFSHVTFSSDGRYLAGFGVDRTGATGVRVWDGGSARHAGPGAAPKQR